MIREKLRTQRQIVVVLTVFVSSLFILWYSGWLFGGLEQGEATPRFIYWRADELINPLLTLIEFKTSAIGNFRANVNYFDMNPGWLGHPSFPLYMLVAISVVCAISWRVYEKRMGLEAFGTPHLASIIMLLASFVAVLLVIETKHPLAFRYYYPTSGATTNTPPLELVTLLRWFDLAVIFAISYGFFQASLSVIVGQMGRVNRRASVPLALSALGLLPPAGLVAAITDSANVATSSITLVGIIASTLAVQLTHTSTRLRTGMKQVAS